MEKFIRLTARACPLDVTNLNTDQLLPARFLKLPRAAGLGTALLRDLRFDSEGRERPRPTRSCRNQSPIAPKSSLTQRL